MQKRNLYLNNTPAEEALEIFMRSVREHCRPAFETIPVTEALHRVTKAAAYAKCSSPHYNAAAMDGIAVTSADTMGASEAAPLFLSPEKYTQVNTGNAIQEPFDAVIMAEDLAEMEDGSVRITAPAAPWQHIRPIGEDIAAGEMILPGSHKIRAIDIGVLLEGGITEIEVVKKPTAAIFPTGSEIVDPRAGAGEGEIPESNSRMFEGLVTEEGGEPHRFDVLPDDFDRIKSAVSDAVKKYDLVIINAGTSAGTEDYTVHVLRELGEVLIHGVAVKPGKPVILAMVESTPVIGLPGYPVSAYIGFTKFVSPVLQYLTKNPSAEHEKVTAVISRRIVSGLKYQEYVRVKVGRVGERLAAAPLARGAGAAMSLVRADGFCVIPQNCEGVEAGDEVEVNLYRSMAEVENTLMLTGSHDLILDVISDIMSNDYENVFLSSTHVGSMAGLMSLKRAEAHMAPTHLLNGETGEYNISYIRRIFDEPMALIKGVERIQGLMVPAGNPQNITGIEDLPGKRYINRQRGAGTRVLLDYRLKQLGISPDEIPGYQREGNTHMAVAAAVKSGSADTGMGVLSAAKAMDLDFVEVGIEEYDFAVPQRFLDLHAVRVFIEILKSSAFHDRLDAMGGYGYSRSGEVILITK
ncbi:MAG: molybdopterin biosynthesis protein [Anaerovoracaceae bacterium]